MKILHLPESFLPYHTGGKETYTLNLIRSLAELNVKSTVLIHQKKDSPLPAASYTYHSIEVEVLPSIEDEGSRKSVYDRSYRSIPGFAAYLKKLQPDLVHFHDFSGGASLTHLKEVKRQGIKAVMTYHSPGQSCMQRALRYANKSICSGKLDLSVCTNCLFQSNGINELTARIFSCMPTGLTIRNTDSMLRRAFTATSATKLFIDSFYEGMSLLDRIHVHAKWVYDLFILNNIRESSLFQARIAGPPGVKRDRTRFPAAFSKERPLRVIFAGRCESIKGIHVLVEAALLLPSDAPVEFHFLGPSWDSVYGRSLYQRIKDDPRFKRPVLIDPSELLNTLLKTDIMVVPSIWPETGPLSMLEAFAAGLPVIGSNIGGIPEWVEHGRNGLLFEVENARDLQACLSSVLASPEYLSELTSHVSVTRTMNDLALEITDLYKEVTGHDFVKP